VREGAKTQDRETREDGGGGSFDQDGKRGYRGSMGGGPVNAKHRES